MSERLRPLLSVLMIALLAAQVAFSRTMPRDWQLDPSPGDPPSPTLARLAALGDADSAARMLTLYLQSFDAQAGRQMRVASIDQHQLRAWLELIADLQPASGYAPFLASRIYAETAPVADARALLDWVAARFEHDPGSQWSWMAHAVFVARHRLHDTALAARYARLLRERTRGVQVPKWARELELFLVADGNETRAARALIGGLVESGELSDPETIELLLRRLNEAKRTAKHDGRPEEAARGSDINPEGFMRPEPKSLGLNGEMK